LWEAEKAKERKEKEISMSRLLGILLIVLGLLKGGLGGLNPWEQAYLGIPNRNNTRNYLLNYTAVPHLAGMPFTRSFD
jgi:hypothetical protein